MKVKSSAVLRQVKSEILRGQHDFICCAIISVETDMRIDSKVNDVTSNAQGIVNTFKPKIIRENMKMSQPWWDKGSPDRMEALDKAILLAVKRND